MIYTLSIEDRVGTGANVTERAVIVEGSEGFKREATYNPNKETGLFNYKGPFDTSFSIVHPFRQVANEVAQDYLANDGSMVVPKPKYDSSVNDAQQKLFENILWQSCQEMKRKTMQEHYVGRICQDNVVGLNK